MSKRAEIEEVRAAEGAAEAPAPEGEVEDRAVVGEEEGQPGKEKPRHDINLVTDASGQLVRAESVPNASV